MHHVGRFLTASIEYTDLIKIHKIDIFELVRLRRIRITLVIRFSLFVVAPSGDGTEPQQVDGYGHGYKTQTPRYSQSVSQSSCNPKE